MADLDYISSHEKVLLLDGKGVFRIQLFEYNYSANQSTVSEWNWRTAPPQGSRAYRGITITPCRGWRMEALDLPEPGEWPSGYLELTAFWRGKEYVMVQPDESSFLAHRFDKANKSLQVLVAGNTHLRLHIGVLPEVFREDIVSNPHSLSICIRKPWRCRMNLPSDYIPECFGASYWDYTLWLRDDPIRPVLAVTWTGDEIGPPAIVGGVVNP